MTDRPTPFSPAMMRAVLREIEAPGTGKTVTRRIPKLCGRPAEFCGGRGDWDDPACWGWADDNRGEWITLTKDSGQRLGWQDMQAAYRTGDRLYAREAWRTAKDLDDKSPSQIIAASREAGYYPGWAPVQFEADGARAKWDRDDWHCQDAGRFRQGMHMKRELSRVTCIVTDVKVERVQDITDQDALREGVEMAVAPRAGQDISIDGDYWPGGPKRMFRTLWDSLNEGRGYGWESNPWVAAISFRPVMGNIDKIERETK